VTAGPSTGGVVDPVGDEPGRLDPELGSLATVDVDGVAGQKSRLLGPIGVRLASWNCPHVERCIPDGIGELTGVASSLP
jgi:hypothetical protein